MQQKTVRDIISDHTPLMEEVQLIVFEYCDIYELVGIDMSLATKAVQKSLLFDVLRTTSTLWILLRDEQRTLFWKNEIVPFFREVEARLLSELRANLVTIGEIIEVEARLLSELRANLVTLGEIIYNLNIFGEMVEVLEGNTYLLTLISWGFLDVFRLYNKIYGPDRVLFNHAIEVMGFSYFISASGSSELVSYFSELGFLLCGEEILRGAVFAGNIEMCQLFVGSETNYLKVLSECSDLETAKFLLKSAKENHYDWQSARNKVLIPAVPTLQSLKSNRMDTFKFIIDSIPSKDLIEESIYIAAEYFRPEAIRYLLDKGAEEFRCATLRRLKAASYFDIMANLFKNGGQHHLFSAIDNVILREEEGVRQSVEGYEHGILVDCEEIDLAEQIKSLQTRSFSEMAAYLLQGISNSWFVWCLKSVALYGSAELIEYVLEECVIETDAHVQIFKEVETLMQKSGRSDIVEYFSLKRKQLGL